MIVQPPKKRPPLPLIFATVVLPFLLLSGCLAVQPLSQRVTQPVSPVAALALIHPATVAPPQPLTATQSALVSGSSVPVTIENFSFDPAVLTVTVGSRVTWTNEDDLPHTVKSVDGLFSSLALDTGESFSFQFDQPGVYRYYCAIHPMMTATVVVR